MADVNDMFDDITKEQSYYTPKEKKDTIPITEGDYLCHITEVDSKILDVQGKYKARLYSYTVEVAEENKNMDYNYTEINGDKKHTKGTPYVGKRLFGKLWRFIEPKEGDDFESNSQGNTNYLRFCETIGVECPKETKNIDGEDIEVQMLPSLSAEDMLGQPVTAFVALGKPWKDRNGKTRQYFDCKFCKRWEGGKKKTIKAGAKDEIPF
jgi:hypothetical protein